MSASLDRIVKAFLSKAARAEFRPGDRVRVIEEQYKPLGLFNRTGIVQQARGRGWYTVKLDNGDFYNFFVGNFAKDLDLA